MCVEFNVNLALIDGTVDLQVYLHTNCIAVLYNVCAACRFASASYVTCDLCPATNHVVMLSRCDAVTLTLPRD
jgi:hypothetical protein